MNTAQTSTSTVQALDVLTVGEPMALFMALQPGELQEQPPF